MKNKIRLFGALKNDEYSDVNKLEITISGQFPDKPYLEAKKEHEIQAEILVNALYLYLPEETFDAITYELVARAHFSIKKTKEILKKREESIKKGEIFGKRRPKS